MATTMSHKNKKIQVNVNRQLANEAEAVINEIGLTPTVVINALYKQIVATGKIPLNLSLTPEQMTALKIRELSKNKPVRKISNEKELEDFFNED